MAPTMIRFLGSSPRYSVTMLLGHRLLCLCLLLRMHKLSSVKLVSRCHVHIQVTVTGTPLNELHD
jgi:hypothetical protein